MLIPIFFEILIYCAGFSCLFVSASSPLTLFKLKRYDETKDTKINGTFQQHTGLSKVMCGLTCFQSSDCRSFSHMQSQRLCLLHDKSIKESDPSEILPAEGFSHYDPQVLVDGRDCAEIKEANPQAKSREYLIQVADDCSVLSSPCIIPVFCDMTTLGGGWTVFQRRVDGSVSFARLWDEYKSGFGDVSAEHWLGNTNLHFLTSGADQELLVELQEWEQTCTLTALHASFSVGDQNSQFQASVGLFSSGTAGDSLEMGGHAYGINGRGFTTSDRDNDLASSNCADEPGRLGGWWYGWCNAANLNGIYRTSPCHVDGVPYYYSAHDVHYGFRWTELKFRRKNFMLADSSGTGNWCVAKQTTCTCNSGVCE